ncbi:MAG: tetratricopeptide repeat protein [Planctomycetaceae bacterium]|nr:tetratricopeptide repeat protein [Planctomycetaceae bacterium]
MAGDENKWAGEWYRRGVDAMNKQNWDLAVESFASCVKFVPTNVVYRQLLRNCTKKKYGDNGKGAGTLAKTKLMGIRSRVKKAKAAEDWAEVCKAAEEGLYLNPWETQLHVELAEASIKQELDDIAQFAYLEACTSDKTNKDLWVTYANFLKDHHKYDEAEKAAAIAQKLDPKDLDIGRLITKIHTEKTTYKGRYEDAESTRDVLFGANAAASQGRRGEAMAPGQSVENDLRHAIRREPDKVENYLKLAAHLKSTKKFQDSYDTMLKAVELSGNDPSVREQAEDAEMLVMKEKLDIARDQANKSENPEDRKQTAVLANEMRDRRIEILNARVERYPSNMNIKLDLAQLLMQLQQWSKAIPLLQKSAQDPRLKTKALVNLGKCFLYDKKLPLARGQFERAMPDLNVDNEPETYKECFYLAARVCEELKDFPAAEKYYGEVLVQDYDYKDAVKRHEALQGQSG